LDIFNIGLTVVTNKGCKDDTTALSYVNIYPNPVADFTYNPNPTDIMDPAISFLDLSLGASQWNWSFGDGDSSLIQNPVHVYADSGNYLVSLYIENQYGCKDSTEKLLRIDPYFIVYIPNTFTPDGDGRNDKFFVKGIGIMEIQYFIFDRWGNRIWEGYNLDSAWDGTYKGETVQIDTYVYKIKIKDVFDKWHTYHGHVNVVK
jgi:gliding motility-associated-like protein